MNDHIIQTEKVSKNFNEAIAVDNLSFYVPEKTIFGFIGPSGSGKTITIRLLTGFYEPTEGEVKVFGISPKDFSREERERIGYLPQLFGLYPNLTVWENLNFAASIYGMPLFRKNRLSEVMEFVELENQHRKLARQLSGGMLRRLNLAATLLHDPDLIFLDEPTAGIDPVLRHKFWAHFRNLRDQGSTLFVTTQYVSEASYCDLVGVINHGSLVAIDSPTNLRHRAYKGDLVDLHTVEPLSLTSVRLINELPFVIGESGRRDDYHIRMAVNEAKTDIPKLLDWCREHGLQIKSIEEYLPPFEDVFIELVKMDGKNAENFKRS